MATEENSARGRLRGYNAVLETRRDDVAPARLEKLAGHPSRAVRSAVAKHARTPSAALARLLRDSDEHVVYAALCHRATPSEALAEYGDQHPEPDVEMLAHHPNSPRAFRGQCPCPRFCRGATTFSRTSRLRLLIAGALRG